MLRSVLACVFFTVLAGCGGTPPVLADLAGTTWTVERIVMSDAEVRRGDGESVTFGAGGLVSISSCNQCSGKATVRDGALVIEPELGCTKRACGPGVLELDRLLAGRALRRDGLYLIADGPVVGLDNALPMPTVVLLRAPSQATVGG